MQRDANRREDKQIFQLKKNGALKIISYTQRLRRKLSPAPLKDFTLTPVLLFKVLYSFSWMTTGLSVFHRNNE